MVHLQITDLHGHLQTTELHGHLQTTDLPGHLQLLSHKDLSRTTRNGQKSTNFSGDDRQ
jgi:hypothetical protein